ncbi:MAG TPA: hypothetical protein DCY91_22245 [Cyanobacteria bacterium UBA11370]|nr:hypothetical protein [Cyanobacteria bacterium UBA11370]HBY79797.1 hypothetical protein [Cyanobacteria bacterium UBA11148]
MSSQSIHENLEDVLTQVQGELLEALWQTDEDCYPWNPAEPEAEAYLAELEAGLCLDHCLEDEEIASNSQVLFNRLHQCWTSLVSSATDTLKVSLSERFTRVPQAWLEAIASQAQTVFQTNSSFAEQLVLCVKPLLPNWSEDDLLTFARPWAYAMRGNSEVVGVRPVEWAELSQMEQIRLSLAVAHSALVQLENLTGKP